MRTQYLKLFFTLAAVVLVTNTMAFASEMDNRIQSSAKDSYVFKTFLKDEAITVESDDGVVTLSGTVSEEAQKKLAQETIASLPGVKNVDNQLELSGDVPAENSDGWIGMQVKYALFYNRNVSGFKTQVSVDNGVVTLKGEATSKAQKELTEKYAYDINGVKDVKNEIEVTDVPGESEQTITEKIDDASITAQSKLALLLNRSTSAFKTGVKTNNGVVTLSGTVNNPAEKDLATKVVSDVRGVTKVVNTMKVK
jgi:hyperosmotically inducible periplasmic protein